MKIESVYVTFPTKEEAMKAAEMLVKEKLIACANIFPVDSIYEWKGELKSHAEHVMIAKLRGKKEVLIKRIKELHSYELPCILFSEQDAEENYGKWVKGE